MRSDQVILSPKLMRLVNRSLEELGNQVAWRFTGRFRFPVTIVEVYPHLSILFIQRDQLLLVQCLLLPLLILKLLRIQLKSSSLLPLHLFSPFQCLQLRHSLRVNLIHKSLCCILNKRLLEGGSFSLFSLSGLNCMLQLIFTQLSVG